VPTVVGSTKLWQKVARLERGSPKRNKKKKKRGKEKPYRREEIEGCSREKEGLFAMTEVSLHSSRRSRRDFAGSLEPLFSSHCGIVSFSLLRFHPFLPVTSTSPSCSVSLIIGVRSFLRLLPFVASRYSTLSASRRVVFKCTNEATDQRNRRQHTPTVEREKRGRRRGGRGGARERERERETK